MPETVVPLLCHVPPELRERVDALAKQEHRTRSKMGAMLIEEALTARAAKSVKGR